MKILKKNSSLALVSAHSQRMPTAAVIFERYDRIFDEKNSIFCYFVYVFINTYFFIYATSLEATLEICKQLF